MSATAHDLYLRSDNDKKLIAMLLFCCVNCAASDSERCFFNIFMFCLVSTKNVRPTFGKVINQRIRHTMQRHYHRPASI